jgi:hypothetical protein
VSPIDDDMLLVLDFLKRHQTITDLKNNTFTIGDTQGWFTVLEETSGY